VICRTLWPPALLLFLFLHCQEIIDTYTLICINAITLCEALIKL